MTIKGQLTIFDYIEETQEEVAETTFSIMDKVRLKKVEELSNPDELAVAYLGDYGHGGKKGTVKAITHGNTVIVELANGNVVYAYPSELVYLG